MKTINPTPSLAAGGPGRTSLGGLLRQVAPTGLTLLIVLILILFVLLYATCTQYIEPDQFAVKQIDVPVPLFTGSAGIHTNIYDTGIRWRLPGCEKFLVFPKSVRVITLHSQGRMKEAGARYVHYEESAHIQTSDGFFINLDVSIIYRVVDPYKVVTEFGAGSLYEQNGIVIQAEPTLKSTMGTLHPEDFFNADKRVAKQEEARDRFNEFLRPRGLQVDHVLIRYPKYHEAVQARIEARNIQEQTRQKNIEEAKLAEALGALKEVEKQGEANLSIKLMEGSNYVTRLTAEMDAYRRKKNSEANKVISLAEAERQRMINEAYQGVGADRLIGLQWAKVLSGLDTIILESGGPNGFNPLDLDSLMRQLKLKPANTSQSAEPVKTSGKK
jgi:regulator of protease activity HflC (stomatin/prohibitin superfamily)